MRRALTLAFSLLAALLPASGVMAEALYGRDHPVFYWESPDGTTRYQIGGSGVRLLDCMASAMAYHEAARPFSAPQSDADWQADHDRLVADWQGIMVDFLAYVPDRVPPEEFPRAAALRIDRWRVIARDMAEMSVLDVSENHVWSVRQQTAIDHYDECMRARNW